ncbi:MAG: hypothetical protein EBU36_04655 [Verrucomicrobia bacterium]|jgi:hypothetical protein|nr:hypothetical protein [Verrucomicrobiota bacterium]
MVSSCLLPAFSFDAEFPLHFFQRQAFGLSHHRYSWFVAAKWRRKAQVIQDVNHPKEGLILMAFRNRKSAGIFFLHGDVSFVQSRLCDGNRGFLVFG